MFKSDFEEKKIISANSKIVFAADFFLDQIIGGAELSSQALIDSCDLKIDQVRCSDITMEVLEQGHDKFWIFGNYSQLNPELIPSIIANLKYSIIEYDYKYCKFRSPEKHLALSGNICDCHDQINGKLISAFLYGAKSIWWMSEKQQDHHHKLFPFLNKVENIVLSSVFDDSFFAAIRKLRLKQSKIERKKWLVLGSSSWIKGTAAAEQWCQENGKEYEIVSNLPYHAILEKLSSAEGLVFLPNGSDTCPRIVIEAKLLGCCLQINDNVQHKDELWFDTDDVVDTESYLYAARDRFWSVVKAHINWQPTISSYTTTLNVERMGYPWRQSLGSMLGFSDEVVVLDGGSDDGSYEELLEWASREPKLVVRRMERDWASPGFSLLDGQQKAEARKICSGDFCWQMDIDEIVDETDFHKIRNLATNFPRIVDLMALPVIEFWGSKGKVRVDVNPWKWRMSRNIERITHGLPGSMRRVDSDGITRSLGSDGCDYIDSRDFTHIPFGTFMTEEIEVVRQKALKGDVECIHAYGDWLDELRKSALPVVFHYSWWDLERKIRNYRDFWTSFWEDLYGMKHDGSNMFFDKSWDQVSESDIQDLAARLQEEMGGWIFHKPLDFARPTPYVHIRSKYPKI